MDAACCVGIVRDADGLKGKDTSIGKKELKGYFTDPEVNNGKRMGVIVVHDIYGMGIPNTKYVVDHFASKGFPAVAPDVFANKALSMDCWPADEFEVKRELGGDEFTKWFGEITSEDFWEKLQADIEQCIFFLRRKGCGKFTVIGFCWGGLAAEAAAKSGKLNAAISCHGCKHTRESYTEVKCPMLYISVPEDSFFPEADHEEIRAAGGTVSVFPGMSHGFMVRGDFANATVNDAANAAFEQALEHVHKSCLRKAKYVKVDSLKPTSRGFNVIVKVAEDPEVVKTNAGLLTEAVCGDETGVFILSLKDEQKEGIAKGRSLVVRNAAVRVHSGYLRVLVDKWGKLDYSPPEEPPEPKLSNNISSVEYELADA